MQGTLFTNSRVTLGFGAIVIVAALLFVANQDDIDLRSQAQPEQPVQVAVKAAKPAAPAVEFASDDELMADDAGDDPQPDDAADAGDSLADDTDFGAPQTVSPSSSTSHAWSGPSASSSASSAPASHAAGNTDSGGANPAAAVVLQ